MWWLIGFLVVVIAIWLLVVSKTFRIVAIAAIVLVVGGIYVGIEYWERQTRIEQNLIKHEEIEIRDLSLSGSYQLTGSLKNLNSSYTLSRLTLDLKFYDCPDKNTSLKDCDIVGDVEEHIYINVPPGQVRGFDVYVYVSNLPKIKGRFTWGYSIESTRANKK